jgi:hypothetical protein
MKTILLKLTFLLAIFTLSFIAQSQQYVYTGIPNASSIAVDASDNYVVCGTYQKYNKIAGFGKHVYDSRKKYLITNAQGSVLNKSQEPDLAGSASWFSAAKDIKISSSNDIIIASSDELIGDMNFGQFTISSYRPNTNDQPFKVNFETNLHDQQICGFDFCKRSGCNSVIESFDDGLSDGFVGAGFVATHHTNLPYTDSKIQISKVDPTGDFLWTKLLIFGGIQTAYRLIQSTEVDHEDYIITGLAGGSENASSIFVARIKKDGSLVWSYAYSIADNNFSVAYDLLEVNGTDILIGGKVGSTNEESEQNSFLMYLDKNGTVQWTKTISSSDGYIKSMIKTGNNEFVATGAYHTRPFMAKFTVSSSSISNTFFKTYADDDRFQKKSFQVAKTSTGFVIGCLKDDDSKDKLWIITTDQNGNTSTGQAIGNTGVCQASDESITFDDVTGEKGGSPDTENKTYYEYQAPVLENGVVVSQNACPDCATVTPIDIIHVVKCRGDQYSLNFPCAQSDPYLDHEKYWTQNDVYETKGHTDWSGDVSATVYQNGSPFEITLTENAIFTGNCYNQYGCLISITSLEIKVMPDAIEYMEGIVETCDNLPTFLNGNLFLGVNEFGEWYQNGDLFSTNAVLIPANGQNSMYEFRVYDIGSPCPKSIHRYSVVPCCKPEISVPTVVCVDQPFTGHFDLPCDHENCDITYTIDYGDGSAIELGSIGSSIQMTPTFNHTYASLGTYTMTICVTNSCTNTTHCSSQTITVGACKTDQLNGVGSLTKNDQYKLFPNPINDKFQISVPDASQYYIQVYDNIGKLVLATYTSTANKNIEVNTASWSNGIYQVHLSKDNLPLQTWKVVKNAN